MSQGDNRQVVLKLYEAFVGGDAPGIFAVLDERVDWLFSGRASDVPFAGHYQGHEGMARFFGTVAPLAEVHAFGPTEMHAFDDKVLALGHERVTVRATDKSFETDWIHFFTLKDGKIVRLREYYDTATMAEAFRNE
jgi:ketosteroid isomerase-like protein